MHNIIWHRRCQYLIPFRPSAANNAFNMEWYLWFCFHRVNKMSVLHEKTCRPLGASNCFSQDRRLLKIYGVAHLAGIDYWTHAVVDNLYSGLGDWKDIFITHVIIIIKREVSTFPIVVIFLPWLCVWDGCTVIFSHLFHIYRQYRDLVSIIDVQSVVFANIMAYMLCSSVCKLHHLVIVIMQTYLKALNY